MSSRAPTRSCLKAATPILRRRSSWRMAWSSLRLDFMNVLASSRSLYLRFTSIFSWGSRRLSMSAGVSWGVSWGMSWGISCGVSFPVSLPSDSPALSSSAVGLPLWDTAAEPSSSCAGASVLLSDSASDSGCSCVCVVSTADSACGWVSVSVSPSACASPSTFTGGRAASFTRVRRPMPSATAVRAAARAEPPAALALAAAAPPRGRPTPRFLGGRPRRFLPVEAAVGVAVPRCAGVGVAGADSVPVPAAPLSRVSALASSCAWACACSSAVGSTK